MSISAQADCNDIVLQLSGEKYIRLKNLYSYVFLAIDGQKNVSELLKALPAIDTNEFSTILGTFFDFGIIYFSDEKLKSKEEYSLVPAESRVVDSFALQFKKRIEFNKGVISLKIFEASNMEYIFNKTFGKINFIWLQRIFFFLLLIFPLAFFRLLTTENISPLFHIDSGHVVIFITGIILTTFIHEISHAICMFYEGGVPGYFGIIWIYGNPGFFLDTSNAWLLSPPQRRRIALSGLASNIVISTIFTIFSLLNPTSGHLIDFQFLAVYNAVIALVNFFPFVKLDGYLYLLAKLDISYLREKSIDVFVSRIANRNFGKNKNISRWLYLYGFGSFYSPFLLWAFGVAYSARAINDGLLGKDSMNYFIFLLVILFMASVKLAVEVRRKFVNLS